MNHTTNQKNIPENTPPIGLTIYEDDLTKVLEELFKDKMYPTIKKILYLTSDSFSLNKHYTKKLLELETKHE